MHTGWATGRFVVGDPSDVAEECEGCGFDAVLCFPLTLILDTGVMPFGDFRACGRCYNAEES